MQKTASALKNISFTAAYTSPLGRCLESSHILMQYHPDTPLYVEDDLKEMSFGDLDGQGFTENKEIIEKCLKEKSFASVHGESDQDVMNRCRRCFERIVQNSRDGDRILIVSHGAYLRRLFAAILNRDVLSLNVIIPNGSITPMIYEDGQYLLSSLPLTPEEYLEGIRK